MKHPDENRRFDTIVGKNKRNALRAVRALRVVSATNNPSGAAKIKRSILWYMLIYNKWVIYYYVCNFVHV